MINIKPQGLKLIVKQLPKKEEIFDGGIIAPEISNADLRENEVIAISTQLEGVINVGDIVLSPDKKGVSQRIDSEWYLWLDAEQGKDEIWGVISN